MILKCEETAYEEKQGHAKAMNEHHWYPIQLGLVYVVYVPYWPTGKRGQAV
tara:strand:+ start:398 stop:550 length:153 start_codon:yes stop_codon:yes gene_type:complete